MTAVAQERARSSVRTPLALDPKTFRKLAGVLFDEAGIESPDAKLSLMFSRLSKRLRALNMECFEEYYRLVTSTQGRHERENMVYALTTNFTKFFREPHHFDYLREHLETTLAARRGERVRIWCTASSTGEEPYSIAMTVLSALPEAARLDVKILATDIDTNVLKRAQEGVYSTMALDTVPAERRKAHFVDQGNGTARASDDLRTLLSFKKLNLIRPLPVKGPFDVIFCRNVAIYFSLETQETVWSNIVSVLGSGGYLYIGHSERIADTDNKNIKMTGVTSYLKS